MHTEIKLSGSQRAIGVLSSLYLALSYLAGIVIYLFILRYPEITSIDEKLRILSEMTSMVFLTNTFMYVLFGPVLVAFILVLKSTMVEPDSLLPKFSAIVGYIWAGSLTASGMIANAAIEPVLKLLQSKPEQASQMWQTLDIVSIGLGNGNGEILGGLMSLGFGIVILKEKRFTKGSGVFGIIVGAIGLLSLIPALTALTGAFGITQLIWFVIVGVSMAGGKGTGVKNSR